jgi:predicted enzyme related to lactoylglutathione lyase
VVSRFSELVIDCNDPRRVADFWKEVLGYQETDDSDGFIEIAEAPGVMPTLLFAPVPEGKQTKNRLHIDVSPRDREQDEEVERIVALGATRADVGQASDVSWVVLADPEGNEFCVLKTRRP